MVVCSQITKLKATHESAEEKYRSTKYAPKVTEWKFKKSEMVIFQSLGTLTTVLLRNYFKLRLLLLFLNYICLLRPPKK